MCSPQGAARFQGRCEGEGNAPAGLLVSVDLRTGVSETLEEWTAQGRAWSLSGARDQEGVVFWLSQEGVGSVHVLGCGDGADLPEHVRDSGPSS